MAKSKKTEVELVLNGTPVVRNEKYQAMVEEIDAVRVETFHVAHETIISGKLKIGEVIASQKSFGVTELIQSVSRDLNINERDLWYCVKFYENYKQVSALPEFASKALSWNKIKKMLASPENAKKVCMHEHRETIIVCADCGCKIKE